MNDWHKRALELAATGMRYRDIANVIESEFNYSNMYNKVKCYVFK